MFSLAEALEYWIRNSCHWQTGASVFHGADVKYLQGELIWMAIDTENGVFLVKLNEIFQFVLKFSKTLIWRQKQI